MNLKVSGKDLRFGGLFSIIAGAGLLLACYDSPTTTPQVAVVPEKVYIRAEAAPEDTAQTLTVVGVGDMMLGTNYPSTSYLPPNDGKALLAPVLDLLKNADVTFGNHEGAILNKGGTPKTCRDPKVCYVFRTPERYVDRFVEAGFDVLSLANNHSGDFGAEGRKRTKAVLREAGIHFAGLAGTDETAIFERNGVKFGFCAFAPNSGTCDLRDIAGAKALVEKLAREVDVVIVSFHGGAEGADHQHVPRATETFHGENRGNVYKFSHAVIDAGADIVFGHGPHVTRAVELYKDRFISYSLGNFCTYGRFSLNGPAGIAPLISLQINREGEFLEGKITPTYQQKTHGPKIDAQKRVIKTIKSLTKADFPETRLSIDDDGIMRKK
jgi:poly-gamma-glutamate capsule biosynthesis protein CapA/YwtB (metallophosphatase superfamily)